MADVVVDNPFFLQDNTQIVPNPTYGRYQHRRELLGEDDSSTDSNSMATLDYQSVSDYNPNYVSNDDQTIMKTGRSNTIGSYPTAAVSREVRQAIRDDEHVNGIPIPSSSTTDPSSAGSSLPIKNSISVKTPDISTVPPGSLPTFSSSPNASSVPLLPPSQASSGGIFYYNSQASVTNRSDDLSSSMGSRISNTAADGKVTPHPGPPPALGPKPVNSQYSFAMQPFTRPGRSMSESETGVVARGGPSPVPSGPSPIPGVPSPIPQGQYEPKHRSNLHHNQTTSFSATNRVFMETNQSKSYGKFNRTSHHYHRDPDLSPTFDLILGIFSIVSILISVVVIVLVIVLVSQHSSSSTTTGGTTIVNLSGDNISTTNDCNCQDAMTEQISKLRSNLQSIKSTLNVTTKVDDSLQLILSKLASLSQDILSLNNTLDSLRQSSIIHASTTLSLSDGCAVERLADRCRSKSSSEVYLCKTPSYSVFEDDTVISDFYCIGRPSFVNTNTFIQTPVNGSGTTIETSYTLSENGPLDQTEREGLKLSCYCYLAERNSGTETECDVYIKRCPIIRDSVPMVLRT